MPDTTTNVLSRIESFSWSASLREELANLFSPIKKVARCGFRKQPNRTMPIIEADILATCGVEFRMNSGPMSNRACPSALSAVSPIATSIILRHPTNPDLIALFFRFLSELPVPNDNTQISLGEISYAVRASTTAHKIGLLAQTPPSKIPIRLPVSAVKRGRSGCCPSDPPSFRTPNPAYSPDDDRS